MTESERLEAVYREYRPKVLDYIRSHVRESVEAEDLCSEVFRKVLEHLAPGSSGVSSYIYTVTRNTVIDYYRTHRTYSPLSEGILSDDSPEDSVISAESLDELAASLRKLPERERDIIVLHYYANNTLHEISDKLDLPYSVVKRAHRSALRQLRALLA